MLSCKVIIVGDGGVGKTSICFRATQNTFTIDYRMTIGTGFFTYKTEVKGKIAALQIWDFGGQERFRTFLDRFAKGASGTILAFDLSDVESFLNLEKGWITFLKESAPTTPTMLIGTKNDLEHSVTKEMIDDFKAKCDMNIIGYWETSAKEGTNIHEFLNDLAKKIFNL
ncbi:MAG: Rab family GTPase [Candidatus Hodarchaeota archaeon]